jgi:hypothetical protein
MYETDKFLVACTIFSELVPPLERISLLDSNAKQWTRNSWKFQENSKKKAPKGPVGSINF